MLIGDLGQDLAIKSDVTLLEIADEFGEGRADFAGCSIDPDLLEGAIVSLLELAITVGVCA